MTSSVTATQTFNITNARKIAAKVQTDLMRFHRFYDAPTLEWVGKYYEELVVYLNYDVVDYVIYGFKRNGMWTEASVSTEPFPEG